MTISSLNGIVSPQQTSSSDQSVINQQAGQRDFAQMFQDIQSGDLSAAQTDLSAYEQSGSPLNSSGADSGSALLTKIGNDLASNDISGAQSDLTDSLDSANQVNATTFMNVNSGASVATSTATDQGASETVKLADGNELTFGMATLSPKVVASFQLKVDQENHDSDAAQMAQQALQAYANGDPAAVGTGVAATA